MSDSRQPVTTGEMPYSDGQTWFRVTGELRPDAALAPVVVVHGGPGVAHNYCLAMADLARDGRAVIHYDQFGCGRSSHRPDRPAAAWTVEFFVEELRCLVDHLGIAGSCHLLGQSWGGMLAPEYVLAHPAGVRSLTVCDSPASMALWLAGANELRAGLPPEVRDSLDRHEAAGTIGSTEYLAATDRFYERHVCRVDPMPADVVDSFTQLEGDPTVYHAMNGPNEFHVIGSLRGWSIVDRLDGIAAPTLVVAGAYDEATPASWAPFVERIADVTSHVFARSSHMPHVEQPEEFLDVVGAFLRRHDPT
jgi:L-proline amide hydrolase